MGTKNKPLLDKRVKNKGGKTVVNANRGEVRQEGLTFDDVLLIPAKSDVLPKDISFQYPSHQTDRPQHAVDDCRHGHGDGSADGHRHRPGGRHRRHPQEYADRVAKPIRWTGSNGRRTA